MKSICPVDPRFRKLPRGISITTSTLGGSDTRRNRIASPSTIARDRTTLLKRSDFGWGSCSSEVTAAWEINTVERAYDLEIPQDLAEACNRHRTALLVYDMQVG